MPNLRTSFRYFVYLLSIAFGIAGLYLLTKDLKEPIKKKNLAFRKEIVERYGFEQELEQKYGSSHSIEDDPETLLEDSEFDYDSFFSEDYDSSTSTYEEQKTISEEESKEVEQTPEELLKIPLNYENIKRLKIIPATLACLAVVLLYRINRFWILLQGFFLSIAWIKYFGRKTTVEIFSEHDDLVIP